MYCSMNSDKRCNNANWPDMFTFQISACDIMGNNWLILVQKCESSNKTYEYINSRHCQCY